MPKKFTHISPPTLIRFMRNYESEMEHASAASGEKASGKELLGEMHEIYYGNRFNIVLGWII